RGALAQLQRAQPESGKGRGLESGTANCTAAITGGHRIGERAHCRVQRANRAAGARTLSAGGIAEAGEGRGDADRADLPADAGRSASLPQEPRRGQLSGTAAGAEELGTKPAADAHQQRRRSLSSHAAGAGSAAHSGPVWGGLRSPALGPEAGGTWGKER